MAFALIKRNPLFSPFPIHTSGEREGTYRPH